MACCKSQPKFLMINQENENHRSKSQPRFLIITQKLIIELKTLLKEPAHVPLLLIKRLKPIENQCCESRPDLIGKHCAESACRCGNQIVTAIGAFLATKSVGLSERQL